MAKKMGNKMVAICSAAIGAIYIAGYVVTDTTTTQAASSIPIATAPVQDQQGQDTDQNQNTDQNQQTTQGQSSSDSASQSSGSSTATSQVKYKDGTFTGSGSNRIGSVTVAVTIKSNKITNVQITDCTTSYPESYIVPLPQQVIQRQSPNVDIVSGATRSTEDFENAVQDALTQAQA